jgi:hypothetical protein
MNEDFSPSRYLNRVLHLWWVIALAMIVCGVAGVLIARIHRPVYESKAIITTILDYSNLEKLDDYDSDQIYLAVGEIIGSSEVKDAVVQKAQIEQLPFTETEILDSMSTDRIDTRWTLRVRLSNPLQAQQVDQMWAEAAMQALTQMKIKAVTGYASQQYINSLVTCLQQTVVLESGSSMCASDDFASIQKEIKTIVDDPASQIASGSLLVMHTSFELTQTPSLPGSPVLFAQNLAGLAGVLIGLVIGLTILSFESRGVSGLKVA